MSEVLAHTTALLEELLNGGLDLGGLSIEAKIPVYFSHKIENRLQQRTPCGKRLARIVGEFPTRPRALRAEDKLVCIQTLLAMVAAQRFHNRPPGWRSGEIRPFDAAHFQFAAGLHDQAVVRLLQREERLNIAEIVFMRGYNRGLGQYPYLDPAADLCQKIARSQAHQMMRYRNPILIVVRGSVAHAIDHVVRSASA